MTENDTKDSTAESSAMDYSEIAPNIKSIPIWKRLAFMLIFSFALSLTRMLIFFIAFVQFVIVLFSVTPNAKLKKFGHSLGKFAAEIIDFLTYYSDEKPFPFDREWPS